MTDAQIIATLDRLELELHARLDKSWASRDLAQIKLHNAAWQTLLTHRQAVTKIIPTTVSAS